MPERKYMSNSAEDCTFVHNNKNIKDRMGVSVGSRDDNVKQYKKYEKKWKKDLKALKKQTKMLYIIAKNQEYQEDLGKIF